MPRQQDPNRPLTAADLAGTQTMLEQIRQQMQQQAQRQAQSVDPRTYGAQYSEMIAQPGALERIDVARPEEIAELVRMRKEGMAGLTAPQYAVAREQMMSQQGAAEQQAQRQLARQQAISGLRGGAAAKQSSRLAQQLAQQRAQQEQNLFMADVGEKQKGMAAYEASLGQAVQGEQARQLFNIEQQQREQLAQQARDLTIAQLSQAQALGERQAQAAERYGSSMASAGGRGKVICTELYHQGYMDVAVFEADQRFGKLVQQHNPLVMQGYWYWAKPLVRLMQRSKVVTKIVWFFAKPWAQEMAFKMGAAKKGSLFGRLLLTVGTVGCAAIGYFVTEKAHGPART